MIKPTITVLGAGYVGLTTAALLSNAGYTVHLIEPNEKRLRSIKKGKSFFYEDGLDELIAYGIKKRTLLPGSSYRSAIPDSDIIFCCVGTPDKPNGSSDLSYVYSAAEQSAEFMKPNAVYVQKSTVPVGTGRDIEALFKKLKANVSYTSNPEFLREGTAVYDALWFDRVVVGGDDKSSVKKIIEIYKQLELSRDKIIKRAKLEAGKGKGKYIATPLSSAELIKVTSNAFLALKISFANSIAKLADATGADVTEIMDAVGSDRRIGRAFLNAGRGYGGGCFPKDVSGLIASGKSYGVNLPIMTAAQKLNAGMPEYIISKIQKNTKTPIEKQKIAVLGLAFKAGTSDSRRSPGIKIANLLAEAGSKVKAYDPQANKEAKPHLSDKIIIEKSCEDCLRGTNVVVITTEWPEFSQADVFSKMPTNTIVVDAVNILDKHAVMDLGLIYMGVGR